DLVAHQGRLQLVGEPQGNSFEVRATVHGHTPAYDLFLVLGSPNGPAFYDHVNHRWFRPTLAGDAIPRGWLRAAGCFATARSRWLVYGGSDQDQVWFGDTWALTWDGTTLTSTKLTGNTPPTRLNAGMAFHQGLGVAVLVGGVDRTTGNYLDDMWI